MFHEIISDNDGVLTVVSGTGAATRYSQGMPVSADSELEVSQDETITHYHHGIPFDADGRVAASGEAVSFWSVGFPFTATGHLAMSSEPVSSWKDGIGYDANGAIAAEGFSSAIFSVLLQSSLIPERAAGDDTPTFTRASAATFTDFEGVVRTVNSGEPRFSGARRVENLLFDAGDLEGASWGHANGGGVTSGASDPLGGNTAYTLTSASALGDIRQTRTSQPVGTYINTFYIKRVSGTGIIDLFNSEGVAVDITSQVTTEWQRFTVSGTKNSVGTAFIILRLTTANDEVDIWHPQLENATGQSNQSPSEYVSTGAGGTEYGPELVTNGSFDTDSDWTKDPSWSISGGTANCDGTQVGGEFLLQTVPPVESGKTYEVTYTISGSSEAGGSNRVRSFVGSLFGDWRTTNGTYTEIVASTGTALSFQADIDFIGSIDNITVKELLYHGANVDGVAYFDYLNPNVVS